jgi:hypothetical protein
VILPFLAVTTPRQLDIIDVIILQNQIGQSTKPTEAMWRRQRKCHLVDSGRTCLSLYYQESQNDELKQSLTNE